MLRFLIAFFYILYTSVAFCQNSNKLKPGKWRVLIHRQDGKDIVFNFLVSDSANQRRIAIVNGAEKIPLENLQFFGDSVFFQLPVFESTFRVKLSYKGMTGVWRVGLLNGFRDLPITAYPANYRFPISSVKNPSPLSGRWEMTFSRLDTNRNRPAVGEFVQKGNKVTGSILTLTGDYRYLEGIVEGDSMKLSTFDGHHAFLFLGKKTADNKLEGMFYSGAAAQEKWIAKKNPTAELPEAASTHLLEEKAKLNFKFPDLDSNIVSIQDERFKNKVVIVQIMGSWCANCMDETRFLSEYYRANRSRGFEVVSLCYERSADFARSVISIQKFRNRFNVEYPMLVTGVIADDPMKAEKTLPQIDKISAFPSFIVLNKKGEAVEVHIGFEGPGTGKHYDEFKEKFSAMVNKLLSE